MGATYYKVHCVYAEQGSIFGGLAVKVVLCDDSSHCMVTVDLDSEACDYLYGRELARLKSVEESQANTQQPQAVRDANAENGTAA